MTASCPRTRRRASAMSTREMKVRDQRIDDGKAKPGVMNSRVSPENGASRPLCAADSRLRTTVVPTAMTRPPAACVRSIAAHTSALTVTRSACMRCSASCRPAPAGSAGADVQRNERRAPPHSHLATPRQHRFVEVQTGCRRGHCTWLARVHGLITSGVIGLRGTCDVGRQRHRTVLLEIRQWIRAELQLVQIVATSDVVSLHAARQCHRRIAA